jgi:ribosomal protein L11 methyltransferase
MPEHHRYELPVAPDEVELLSARLWLAGALGCWQQPGSLTAWFADRDAPVPPGGRWSVEPDRDWQAEWKATIGPIRAGRVTVVPSWLADEYVPAADELTLVLDPGRAFGSGHHATTTLCLELLDELDLEGREVADVGCGTGILAIAAAARGARVVAVDIDPEAVEVTGENAARNGVSIEAKAGSIEAEVGSVEAIPQPTDIVVANLVTDVIVALAEQLVAATGTTFIASGITVERRERAIRALGSAGLRVEEVRERDGWIALRGTPAGARTRGEGGEVAADEPPPRR